MDLITFLAVIAATALIALIIIGSIVSLAVAARANYHVRQDLPPSARRTSVTRWSFWTGGSTAWGGALRLAVASPDGMDDLSLYLRGWCRQYLGWSTLAAFIPMVGLAATTALHAGSAIKAAVFLPYLLSLLAIVYCIHKLRAELQGRHEPLEAAAGQTLKWLCWTVGLAVPIVAVSAAGAADAGPAAAALALVGGLGLLFAGLKLWVHFSRLALLIAIEGRPAGETEDTPCGGANLLAALAYGVVFVLAAGALQLVLGVTLH